MTTLLVNGKPHGGPDPEVLLVPFRVARCPECGGRLLVQLSAWEVPSGRPLEDGEGLEWDCENEPDPDDPEWNDKHHRFWQGEWQETVSSLRDWVRSNVTVWPGPVATMPKNKCPAALSYTGEAAPSCCNGAGCAECLRIRVAYLERRCEDLDNELASCQEDLRAHYDKERSR